MTSSQASSEQPQQQAALPQPAAAGITASLAKQLTDQITSALTASLVVNQAAQLEQMKMAITQRTAYGQVSSETSKLTIAMLLALNQCGVDDATKSAITGVISAIACADQQNQSLFTEAANIAKVFEAIKAVPASAVADIRNSVKDTKQAQYNVPFAQCYQPVFPTQDLATPGYPQAQPVFQAPPAFQAPAQQQRRNNPVMHGLVPCPGYCRTKEQADCPTLRALTSGNHYPSRAQPYQRGDGRRSDRRGRHSR
jgi:hypothetical protein